MRLFSSLGIAVLLLGGLTWGQESESPQAYRVRRIQQQQQQRQQQQQQQQRQQQNPADFAPDPPPVPTPRPAATATPQIAAIPTPVPTPPEELPPPTPPQVAYRDGLLTVQATNSSLQALLIAIRNKAGIQFEGLENGAPERVAIAMGPAREADVLATILGGSNFDYVVMERPDSPGIVQRVVLSPKAGTGAVTANAGQTPHPQPDVDEEEDVAAEEPANPQDTAVRPPLAQAQSQAPPPQQPQASPPQPRSSEQMVEEIRKLQQQQQQQQQPQAQETPQNTAPVKPPEN